MVRPFLRGLIPLLLAAVVSCPALAAATPTVLALASYSEDDRWTEAQIRGLRGALGDRVDVIVEFMDMRRLPDGRHLDALALMMERKYAARPPQVVVAMDEDAVRFLVAQHDRLFQRANAVFQGATFFDPAVHGGQGWLTGVVADVDIRGTLEAARLLQPGLRRVVVVNGEPRSGIGLGLGRALAVAEGTGAFEGLVVDLWEEVAHPDLLRRLSNLTATDAVLLLSLGHDEAGLVPGDAESTRAVARASGAPVYGLWAYQLGAGLLGGRVLLGHEQGKVAAELVSRLLGGERPDAVGPVLDGPKAYMFDHGQLARFGLDGARLPDGSRLINTPPPLLPSYRDFPALYLTSGLAAAGVAAALAALVLRLQTNDRVRRGAEAMVAQQTEALRREIEQRRRADERVRANEKRFRDLVATVPGMVYQWAELEDDIYGFTWVSPQAREMFGLEPTDLERDCDYFTIHPDDRELWRRSLRIATEHGIDWEFEGRLLLKDGSMRWWKGLAKPMPTNGGMLFNGIILDITNERLLREETDRLRTRLDFLLNASPSVIYAAEPCPPYTTTFISAGLREMGYTPEEATANPDWWADRIHPDDRPGAMTALALLDRKDALEHSYRFRTARGDWIWVIYKVFLVRDEAGHPTELIGSMADITPLRTAEEALRTSMARQQAILASTPMGIAILDCERRFEQVNERFCSLFGLAPSTFLGHSARLIYRNEAEFQELGAAAYPVIQEGGVFHGERQLRRSDGASFWCALTGCMVDRGRPELGCVWIVDDITTRKAAELTLRSKTAELERSNGELEAFAYVASHDLRQPLRVVNSYLGLLERRLGPTLDAEGREFIGFARDGAQRMDRLIVDLLEYSRVGRRSAPSRPVALGEIARRAVGNLEIAIAESGAEVTIGSGLPTVDGDENELVRLLQNLIGNAVKYHAPDRPPRVTLTVAETDGAWTFAVTDNGIGIAPEHRERVFGIFQRLHSREAFDGTGIGLAVCRKIVERHGGRIWVDAAPEAGSRFVFTLPRRDAIAA